MRVALCLNKHRRKAQPSLWRLFRRLGVELDSRGVKVVHHGREHRTIKSCPVHVRNHGRNGKRNNWNVKESYLPPYAYFDRCGYAGWAEFCSSDQMQQEMADLDDGESLSFFNDFAGEYRRSGISKYVQAEQGFALDGPYVFVACQLPYDTVMKLAHIKTIQMARMVADAYKGTGVTVVVKPHPNGKPAVRRSFEQFRPMPHVHMTSTSIHEILPGADCVYTVNSGVGLEALLYERPVFVTGKSDYQFACQILKTREDIIRSVVEEKVFDKVAVSKLIHYLFTRVYVNPGDDAAISRCVNRIFEEAGW